MAHHSEDHPTALEHHIVPVSTYLAVFAGLMVLFVATALVAAVDLGPFNTVIALLIAFAKMLLIVLFFMHLRWSSWMVRAVAGAAIFWLMIMFVLTFDDYFSRVWFQMPLK